MYIYYIKKLYLNMTLDVVRTSQGLVAADPESAKELNKFGDGEIVKVTVKKNRSYLQMKYYRKMLQMVYDNLPEVISERYPIVENFHTEMKFLCGLVEVNESITGDRFYKVQSVSFDKMGHEKFTEYVQNFKDRVHEYFIPGFDFGEIDRHMVEYYQKRA